MKQVDQVDHDRLKMICVIVCDFLNFIFDTVTHLKYMNDFIQFNFILLHTKAESVHKLTNFSVVRHERDKTWAKCKAYIALNIISLLIDPNSVASIVITDLPPANTIARW